MFAVLLFSLVAAMLLCLAVLGFFLDWLSRLEEPDDDYRKWPGT
jgi:hypothetical protein